MTSRVFLPLVVRMTPSFNSGRHPEPFGCAQGKLREVSAFLLVLFLLCALQLANAAPPNGTVISLGSGSGQAKSQVSVPLFLTPDPPSLQVGEISATITFNNKDVSFVKAEKGFLLDSAGAAFEVKSENDPKDPNKSILHLEVATKGEPRQPLHDGLVLTLAFQIPAEASAGAKVDLVLEKVSANDLSAPPKAIAVLPGKNGTIEVMSKDQAPYVACFFFSH